MKTFNSCMECQVERGIPRFSTTELVEIPDNGVFLMTCDRGHQTAGVLQNERYQILSTMAVEAIVYEYYRDAVASFASALERLWEFGVQAICRRQGVKPEVFGGLWKPMANLSERQTGAYLTAYGIETNSVAPMLSNPAVAFRNRVIHKGYLPSRAEAIQFGQWAADCAYPLLLLLGGKDFEKTITDLTFDLLRARGKNAVDSGKRTSTISLAVLFTPTQDLAPIDIAAAVEKRAALPDFGEALKEMNGLGRSSA